MSDGPLFDRLRHTGASQPAVGWSVMTRPEGLYLPQVDLYLDPRVPVARAFVSHAHADHAAAVHGLASEHPLRLVSRETDVLLRARHGDIGPTCPLAWGERTDLGTAHAWLVPAGHVLGAAALVLESEHGVLVYTGDVKPGAGATHPAAALPRCDALVIESTFGLPIFSFPTDADNHRAMVDFARATLAEGETPVFLAYAFGKGQEIAQVLGMNEVPVRAHGAMTRLNEAYRALGVALPLVRPYARDDEAPPGALIVPPRERFGAMFKRGRGRRVRVAHVSGWALFDASRERYDADLQVPLSDHASFAELEQLVDGCAPRVVYVTHGYAASYARHLRARGIDARAIDATGYEA